MAAWHELIGVATLADAILDRIVHNSLRITLGGDSMRKRKTPTLLTGGEITVLNHP
ncbi:ATP-binding protein [Rhizobium ruizarguesonis]